MLDRNSVVPLYYQIYQRLKRDILDGMYGYNEPIPSENRLVKKLAVSKLTIVKAIGMLVDEGLLVRKVGSGTYAKAANGSASSDTRKREVLFVYPNILKLDGYLLNNPELDTSTITFSLYSALYYANEHGFKIKPMGINTSERRSLTEMLTAISSHYGVIAHYPFGDMITALQEVAKMQDKIIISSFNVIEAPRTYSIVVDNDSASREIARWFVKKGHRRLAYIGLSSENYNSRIRWSAFSYELRKLGIEMDERYSYREGLYCNIPCGEQGAAALLGRLRISEYPTGIYCFNDNVAAGVLRTLTRRGIKVPDDISLFGFNNSTVSEAVYPKINSVSFDLFGIGMLAAQLLDRILFAQGEPPRVSLMKTKLVIKES